MGVMTAVGWIGAFFLLAVIIRAKIKPIGNMLVPACLIGGVIGCVIINTVGLPWTTTADYSLISGQMYNFMFINLGITVAAKAEEKKRDKRSFSIREPVSYTHLDVYKRQPQHDLLPLLFCLMMGQSAAHNRPLSPQIGSGNRKNDD